MTRLWRVRDRASFAALRRDGARGRSGPVAITRLAPKHGGAAQQAVAFALPRSVGSAVTRNRLRRRLRAAASAVDLAPGTYLVRADNEALTCTFAELTAHLDAAAAVTLTRESRV